LEPIFFDCAELSAFCPSKQALQLAGKNPRLGGPDGFRKQSARLGHSQRTAHNAAAIGGH
jgi:hypothetical protein